MKFKVRPNVTNNDFDFQSNASLFFTENRMNVGVQYTNQNTHSNVQGGNPEANIVKLTILTIYISGSGLWWIPRTVDS